MHLSSFPLRLGRAVVSLLLLLLLWLPTWAAADEPVRLRFVFAAEHPGERAALLDGVARFEAAHPNVRVEPVPYQWSGYGFHDTLVRLLALEDPSIDVYRIDVPWIPELAAPGWLLPLDRHIDDDDLARFLPVTIAGGSHGNTLYALPLSLKGNLLFYRRDLLEARGLAPPQTLDELAEQAARLRSEEGLAAGLAVHPAYFYNDVLPMLWASGGDVLDENGEVVLDSPQNVAVLETLAGMVGDGPEAAIPRQRFEDAWSRSYSALFDDFLAGEAAFAITWSPRWHVLRGSPVDGRVGVTSIPGLQAGPGSSNLGSFYVAVNAFSEHPEEAAEFVRFMAGPEAQAARVDIIGEVPAHLDVLDDPATMAEKDGLAAMVAPLASGGIRPRVADERALGAILEACFHGIVFGGQPASEALAQAATRITSEVGSLPPQIRLPAKLSDTAPDPWAWTHPMRTGGLVVVLLLTAVLALLEMRRRRTMSILVTLQAKLLLAGLGGVAVLVVTSTAVATSIALRAQHEELNQQRTFFSAQLQTQAESLGKSTALALTLIEEQGRERSPEAQRADLEQLLMVSQFDEDVLFIELLDVNGDLRMSDRDALYWSEASSLDRPAVPDALDQLVASRRVHAFESQGDGPAWVEVLVPCFLDGVHHGALRLGFSRHRFDAILAQTERRHAANLKEMIQGIVLTGLLLLLLYLLGVINFARHLSRPVEALTLAAQQVRTGDLRVQIRASSRDEIGTLAETMAEMVSGLRDRDFIRDAFGRYLTRELADKLVEDPSALQLGGHARTVTILMSDLRGFSGLSERLGPEAMVVLLNRYLAAMTTVIVAHRGMINEFIGDAILVLFGALETGEDDVDRALRCALDMQRALREFNRENEALGLPVLAMGIGVNTGTVVAGNIGSPERVKYGVVGPPVNHAARLESLTIGSQIHVSASALQAATVEARRAGPLHVQVKGSRDPLVYFDLLGVVGSPELDMPPREHRVVEVSWQARFARLDGKRVPDARIECCTRAVGSEQVMLAVGAGLSPQDNVVVELQLPNHGWTGPLWAKVLACSSEVTTLALTSGEPGDLAALAAHCA